MPSPSEIHDSEVVLRRVPPSGSVDSVCPRPEGGMRATSAHLSIRHRRDEIGVSCSRLLMTSPSELLELLRKQGIDPVGWFVCRMFVSDIREAGLEVVCVDDDHDPGHCEIRGQGGVEFPSKANKRLSKINRILTDDEVAILQAGDSIDD